MQYAFAYYYYVINRYKATPPDLHAFVAVEIDANRDGYLDENEFRTLACIVEGTAVWCLLCCTVLYCAILCYTVLYCAVLCYIVLYCAILSCTVLYLAVLSCT